MYWTDKVVRKIIRHHRSQDAHTNTHTHTERERERERERQSSRPSHRPSTTSCRSGDEATITEHGMSRQATMYGDTKYIAPEGRQTDRQADRCHYDVCILKKGQVCPALPLWNDTWMHGWMDARKRRTNHCPMQPSPPASQPASQPHHTLPASTGHIHSLSVYLSP